MPLQPRSLLVAVVITTACAGSGNQPHFVSKGSKQPQKGDEQRGGEVTGAWAGCGSRAGRARADGVLELVSGGAGHQCAHRLLLARVRRRGAWASGERIMAGECCQAAAGLSAAVYSRDKGLATCIWCELVCGLRRERQLPVWGRNPDTVVFDSATIAEKRVSSLQARSHPAHHRDGGPRSARRGVS
mmetsp:Transcript_3462/g.9996  ORF Transcript_3462/g.9996 Transcript_3462/m.9996 type:complete len:187 (+) Transcript_3462:1019-1579(+)